MRILPKRFKRESACQMTIELKKGELHLTIIPLDLYTRVIYSLTLLLGGLKIITKYKFAKDRNEIPNKRLRKKS